jgi:hypothetical protein
MTLMTTTPSASPVATSVPLGASGKPPAGHHRGLWAVLTTVAALIGLATLCVVVWPSHRDTGTRTETFSWQVNAISKATGLPLAAVRISASRVISTATGDRYDMDVAGIGIVQANPITREITEIVYADRLTGSRVAVPAAAAAQTAHAYAAQHFTGLAQLTPRGATQLDHGSWVEFRVVWQQRTGAAWTPTQVAVGVNAASGQVAYFWSDRLALTVPTTPQVTASEARAAALRLVTAESGRSSADSKNQVVGPPELQVVALSSSKQQLVWSVAVRSPRVRGLQIARDVTVHVDAHTGSATLWATS